MTDDQQQVDRRPLRIGRAAVTAHFVVGVFIETPRHLAAGQSAENRRGQTVQPDGQILRRFNRQATGRGRGNRETGQVHGETRRKEQEIKLQLNITLPKTDRQTDRSSPEGLVGGDERKRVFPSRFHRGHVQGDGEGGDAQLEALLVGVNPEVVTPEGGIGAAPRVLHGDLSMELWGGGAWLASRC